jgi:enoyl-CoA hydratase/carnithine racemase
MSEHIECGIAAGVQTIRIARPEKKNALTVSMYEQLTAAFEESERDDAVRVRLIMGLPGAFSAGNDFTDFIDARKKGIDTIPTVTNFLRALVFSENPLIAAVDGFAFGIGATLLLNCDMAYATRESVFTTPLVDLGLLPEGASSLLGPQQMGYHAAFAFIAAGEPLTAEAAFRARLINLIVPRDTLEKHALGVATKLAAKPPKALAISRKLLRPDPYQVWERIELEAGHYREQLASTEARDAYRAFMQRRSALAAE